MKVIDLLNKIANGEEVPKDIKYKGWLFSFDRQPEDYYCEEYGNLFEYLINEKRISEFLNDEVETIEEEKKIPEKIQKDDFEGINEEEPKLWIAIRKINEIIDYLKNKGDE